LRVSQISGQSKLENQAFIFFFFHPQPDLIMG
jgi:hypothetical protein